MNKTYTVVKTLNNNHTHVFTGTLDELVRGFAYTLDCGRSYQNQKGCKKINTEPKSIKSLVSNLNNAANNTAADGYTNGVYELVTG